MAERTEAGSFAQQDAEECWSLLLNDLIAGIPTVGNLFTGKLKTSIVSAESGESSEFVETFTKLSCHIGQGM